MVLEDGITIGGKPLKDHFEAIGHSEAFDLLYKLADSQDITETDILGLHRLFYYRIDTESAGKYRERNVIITGTDFTPPTPTAVPLAMRSNSFLNIRTSRVSIFSMLLLPNLTSKMIGFSMSAFIVAHFMLTRHPFC